MPAEAARSPVRVQLARRVVGELVVALIQIQDKGIMHRCPAGPGRLAGGENAVRERRERAGGPG